nr:hypothetical protein [Planctomyces sp. SH-PL14]
MELGDVVVDHGVEVRLARRRQSLGRLQDLDRKSLDVLDPLQVEGVGLLGRLNRGARPFDAALPLRGLAVRLGDFTGDAVEERDLPPLRLADERRRFVAGRPLAVAEVADLPVGDRIGIQTVVGIANSDAPCSLTRVVGRQSTAAPVFT